MTIHTVQAGDSIYAIARKYDVPPARIIQDNQLTDPSRLAIGQALLVTFPSQLHTVRAGDTLGKLATQYGTTVRALWQNNPQLGGTDRIYVGDQLVISYSQPKQGKLTVNGYAYPFIDKNVLRKTLPYLTYLSVFSTGFNDAGNIIPLASQGIVDLARAYQVEPLLVVTTLGEDGNFSGERAAQLLQSAAMQENFITSLIAYLQAEHYSGVDIDFEYIPTQFGTAYADFVAQVTQRLNPYGLRVMVALAPKTSAIQRGVLYEAHDYAALGEAANQVLLMTYEWGYSMSQPMAVAPLDKVSQVLDYALTAIPAQKILLGMPNYGYDWTLPYSKGKTRAQSIGNMAAMQQAIERGATIEYDTTAQSPHYTYYRDGKTHAVWFEDARSVAAKLTLASQNGIDGVSVWNLMKYFPQLWLQLAICYRLEG